MAKSQNPRTAPASKRSRRLPRAIVSAIDASKILGVRAGARSDHRFIGIWPVVVDGRVFARSWTLKPEGWYHTFLSDPLGALQVGERRVRIRAVRVRSQRIREAVERAYAQKYSTPASMKYVRGFRTERRRQTTTEFVPR
jgi:hypothetical protein